MADFQDPKELEHYLKTAAELECTAYRLEKSIGAANVAEIKLEELCKVDTTRYISKPKPKKVEPPTPPEPPSKPDFMYSEVNAKIANSTILGAMLLGLSRAAAAEFSFFMAIPTMIGASGIKALKFVLSGTPVSGTEWGVLAVGFISAFLVSLAAIRFLMDFVKKHTFSAFGWYRIIVGVLVLGVFALQMAGVLA